MPDSKEAHLEWAKTRAMKYVEIKDYAGAINSLSSDLVKHPETAAHPAIVSAFLLRSGGKLNDAWSVTQFINDVQ